MRGGLFKPPAVVYALAIAAGLAVTGVAGGAIAGPSSGQGGRQAVPIVEHLERYAGNVSAGVRARYAIESGAVSAAGRTAGSIAAVRGNNVRMNTDSTPPWPQDEPSVAYNVFNPLIAVAAANDYTSFGFWIGRTTNGGKTWSSSFKAPVSTTFDNCGGSDPSVVYSRRDRAFYLATLCFTFVSGISEIQVWKSVDNGKSWTPSPAAATPISNVTPEGIDTSVFYDKELLAVDNNLGSPNYGRLYMTYIKFHMLPDGYSDYCPLQVASTSAIPTEAPYAAEWTITEVVPDDPDGLGVGEGANQGASPVTDNLGGLNIAYLLEECNTGIDSGIRFTRSTDGGATFSEPIAVDKPGQWADIANPEDLLPDKSFRTPSFPSMVFNPVTKALDMIIINSVGAETSGADISFAQSTDYGATWSDMATISLSRAGEPARNDQFFPALGVDGRGTLHAIWYDTRRDPGNKLIDTYQAISRDDGETWSFARISTASFNPDDAFFDCGCFIGDYNWIAASTKVIYPVWTDGRDSPGSPDGDTNIYTNVELGGIR